MGGQVSKTRQSTPREQFLAWANSLAGWPCKRNFPATVERDTFMQCKVFKRGDAHLEAPERQSVLIKQRY